VDHRDKPGDDRENRAIQSKSRTFVIPAKAGIHGKNGAWLEFILGLREARTRGAGMTKYYMQRIS
jgi:hypothetical protein